MELVIANQNQSRIENVFDVEPDTSFIISNTVAIAEKEMSDVHIIPVFVKDNEPLISHTDFINATNEAIFQAYPKESIRNANIRVSHPIKGRVPTARDKPSKDLTDDERTIYFERMMFLIEIPSISETINGNKLNLTVGGVKAYNVDNLYSKKGSDEHFKVFIGFQNKVCCNLCVWSDGLIEDLKVKNTSELIQAIYQLITNFNLLKQLNSLMKLNQFSLSEQDFANVIGRARMYNYLKPKERLNVPILMYGDTQMNSIVKDYYSDLNFNRFYDGSINMWNFYNLFTGANKQSYIDTFLGRTVNAFDFTNNIVESIENKSFNWFLN